MDAAVAFITGWKDLITKVFGSHPLAGALVTLIAVAAFYLLNTRLRKGATASNLFWVFFGWAVAVPIVGLVFDVGGEVYGAVRAVLGFLWSALAGLYAIYTRHPIFILVLLAIAVVGFFVWAWLRPGFIASRPLRAVLLSLLVVAVAHVGAPIVDLFGDTGPAAQQGQGATSAGAPAASRPAVQASLPAASPPAASVVPQGAASAASGG